MRKRITAALLALLLAGLGCGCGRSAGDEGPELPVLVIGSDDYEPYNYLSEEGKFTGFDVELAEEACRRMGYRPEFRHIVWEEKDELLESGELDCLWGCFTMTGRETLYCWAGPYFTSRQMVAVRTESDVRSLADLAGLRVAVQATSKPEELFLNRPTPGIPAVGKVYCFSTTTEIFTALRKGYADAAATHESALRVFAAEADGDIRILDEPLFISELGVAFTDTPEHAALAQELTETLQAMEAEGFTAAAAEKYGLTAEVTAK